jgi:hypothetical protein
VAGAISGSQTVSYLFFTLCHGSQNRRPNKLHAEHDKADKGYHLPYKRKINIHALLLTDY